MQTPVYNNNHASVAVRSYSASMSLPGVVTLFIVGAATAAALLCVLGSLIFLAFPRLRHAAPYLGLVYPGAYLGALLERKDRSAQRITDVISPL